METRAINNIFNKNERRYSDVVKTQKACGLGWDSNKMGFNVGLKIKQTTSI